MTRRVITAREQHEMLSPWLGMRRITPRSSEPDLGDPVPRGSVYYHNTDREFEPGDELIPAQESGHDSRWKNAPGYLPSMVYVYDEHGDPDEYSSLGRHRYEVEPIGDIHRDPEQHHNRAFQDLGVHDPTQPTGNAHSYVVPRARVIRRAQMLSPWRRVAATEPFPLSSVMRIPKDNGRYRIDYHSGPEPGQRGIHTWTVSPASYPAVDSYTTQWGQDKTLYYDPAVIQPQRGEFGHEYKQPPNAHIKDVAPGDQGLLWRGMSHEEYENAKQQGYFQSKGEGNIGDDQRGLTLFSTGIEHAGVYASSGASQHRATFGKPAHIVGIPMRPWNWELDHEKGIRGQIPFSDMVKHYVGHPYAIKPGKIQVYDDQGLSVMGGGGGIGGIYHAWHEDHPNA